MANRDYLVGKVIAQRYRIDTARTDGSGTPMVFGETVSKCVNASSSEIDVGVFSRNCYAA